MLINTVASQSQHSSSTTTITNNSNVVDVTNRAAKSSTIRQVLSISSGILIMTSCFISGYCFHTFLDTNYHHWMRSLAVINTMSDTAGGVRGLLRARSPSSGQQQQQRSNNNNLPEEWETYSFSDIYQHFHCSAHAYDETKPIPSLEQWLYLRMQYNELVDGSVSFNDAIPPTRGYTLSNTNEPPPFYAKASPGKGRGLFASRDIQKGEVVHDGSNSDVVFPDAMSFRRFLFASPRTMACDVMEWAWTQQFEDDGPYHICLSINISSLMNTKDDDEGEGANALPVSGLTSKFYALKDIKKDEEILTDYTIYDTDWVGVGMDEPKKRRR